MKKKTDIFEDFERASDDITAGLSQCCEPLAPAEEKRIFALMESKYQSRKAADSAADQVEGVEIYRRPAWYRGLSAAAVLVVISGIIGGTVFLGSLNKARIGTDTPSAAEGYPVETSATHTDPDEEKIEYNIRPELGEKFVPYTIVESGAYLTVESAEIFHNLNDAGINADDTNYYKLLTENGEPIEEFNRITEELAPVYDKDSGEILNGFSIVKIHFTFENENAVSKVNEFVPLPEERYDDDVFSVGALQLCDADDSNMNTPYNYYIYLPFYFSLEGTVNYTSIKRNSLFRCPPGEKVGFDMAYLFDCAPEHLNIAITSGNKKHIMVDLKLG